jgi:hypothetical protein
MSNNEKFEYFIEQTNERLRTIDETMRAEFGSIHDEIRKIDRVQWKMIGGYVAMSVIAGGIGSFILAWVQRGV